MGNRGSCILYNLIKCCNIAAGAAAAASSSSSFLPLFLSEKTLTILHREKGGMGETYAL